MGALHLARRTSPFVRQHFAFALLYLLTFGPLLMAIVGVQNTALSLLCFALVFWAKASQRPWLMGVGAALLLYKPQFGALFLFYLLGRGHGEALAGWLAGALLLYLLGIPVQGWAWPLPWLQAATQFGQLNFTINDHNMISLAGLVYWAVEVGLGNGARGLPWAYGLAGLLLVMSLRFVRGDVRRLALAPALVLLLSPQTIFYDIAIALFYLIQGLRPGQPGDFILLAGIWLYAVVALLVRDQVGFPTASILLLLMLWIHFQRLRTDESAPPGHAG